MTADYRGLASPDNLKRAPCFHPMECWRAKPRRLPNRVGGCRGRHDAAGVSTHPHCDLRVLPAAGA